MIRLHRLRFDTFDAAIGGSSYRCRCGICDTGEYAMDDWREFQEKVADLFRKIPECRVFVNHVVSGSRGKVNVDVFVIVKLKRELFVRTHMFEFTIIVECKCWKARVSQDKVFALKTVVEDTGASLGLLVTEKGIQKGAASFLQRPVNVAAMTFAQLKAQVTGLYSVICSGCGKRTTSPFDVKNRVLFCRDCFSKR